MCVAACGNKGTVTPSEVVAEVGPQIPSDVSGEGHVVQPDAVGEELPPPEVTPEDNYIPPDLVPEDLPPVTDIWTPQECQSHADCEGIGMCVEVAPGSGQTVCAPYCVEECPGNWECKSIYVDGPDPVSLCFPPTETICSVCTANSQCILAGALCLKGSGALGFCGKFCHPEESPECPEGFECRIAKNPNGDPLGHQCQPPLGSCCVAGKLKECDDDNPCTSDECDPSLGCQHINIDGPCEGPEPCADYKCINGACIGLPITEDLILDGIDEDCDGLTDEDWALGAQVVAPVFCATGHRVTGAGVTVRGALSGPPVAGVAQGGDFKVFPVTTKLGKSDEDD